MVAQVALFHVNSEPLKKNKKQKKTATTEGQLTTTQARTDAVTGELLGAVWVNEAGKCCFSLFCHNRQGCV